MIKKLEHKGKLIHECTIEGDTRAEGLFPGHINAAQASRNRFIILYTTRNWRGSDDNCSVICQLRDGAYDGPVIREIRLAESINDWRPFDDGKVYVKAHVHPLVFGVPKGAVIDGKVPDHAGLFVFMWNRHAREQDPETGFMLHYHSPVPKLSDLSVTEWVQVRLNEAEDDLEIVQPVMTKRQKDYFEGYPFCELNVRRMALTMNPPVPYTGDGRRWIGSTTFSRPNEPHRVAAIGMTYNLSRRLYEWTECGPLSVPHLFESAILGDEKSGWIFASRIKTSMRSEKGGPIAWMKLDDPFGAIPEPVCPEEPVATAPITAFKCADGTVRLLTTDPNVSPYGHARNPIYMWDIDPEDGFRAVARHTIFDSVEHKLPIREESKPVIDQAKVFPHIGGNRQIVAHRVRPRSLASGLKTGVVVNEAEKETSGIYYAEIEYDAEYPGLWNFGDA